MAARLEGSDRRPPDGGRLGDDGDVGRYLQPLAGEAAADVDLVPWDRRGALDAGHLTDQDGDGFHLGGGGQGIDHAAAHGSHADHGDPHPLTQLVDRQFPPAAPLGGTPPVPLSRTMPVTMAVMPRARAARRRPSSDADHRPAVERTSGGGAPRPTRTHHPRGSPKARTLRPKARTCRPPGHQPGAEPGADNGLCPVRLLRPASRGGPAPRPPPRPTRRPPRPSPRPHHRAQMGRSGPAIRGALAARPGSPPGREKNGRSPDRAEDHP